MQNGVTISTNEKDLNILYGPNYGCSGFDECDAARTSLKYILADMNDIRERYIRLGFHLSEFQSYKYYYDFGYTSMEDFCAANLGLDRSAVSRCINVYLAFNASKSVTYENGLKKVGSAMELDDRYKEYSYSQLCEMVSMKEEERKQITPDMTIRQIRELKKKNVSRDVSQVATSQQKKFDYDEYKHKYGIVLQNYIKSVEPKDLTSIHIFDCNGKKLFLGRLVDILERGKNGLFIRLYCDEEEIVRAIKSE